MARMRTGRKDSDDPKKVSAKQLGRVPSEAENTQAGGSASSKMQKQQSASERKAEIAALNKKYRSGEMDYQTMKAETQKLRTAKEQKQIKKQAGHSKGFSGKSSFQGAANGSMLCAPSGGSCSPKKNKTLGGKF